MPQWCCTWFASRRSIPDIYTYRILKKCVSKGFPVWATANHSSWLRVRQHHLFPPDHSQHLIHKNALTCHSSLRFWISFCRSAIFLRPASTTSASLALPSSFSFRVFWRILRCFRRYGTTALRASCSGIPLGRLERIKWKKECCNPLWSPLRRMAGQ